jgi:RNA polymerase sigma factor (sigma-70 family)
MFAPNNGIVYPIIKKYSSINPLYEWEDLQQEAYISKMYTDKHHDETKGQYNTLLGIAVNHQLWKAVNHKNNTTSSLNVKLADDTDDEVIDLIEDNNTIDLNEKLFQYELKTLLNRKIYSYLTIKEQTALFLYYWAELTIEDIALLLDIHKSYARELLVKARRVLRKDPDLKQFYIDNINNDYQ